jgi:transcriptional regulator with XRE-family HTH domain
MSKLGDEALVQLGCRISQLRGTQSQNDLAKKALMRPGALSSLERGLYDPSAAELQRLARAFGVKVGVLLEDGAAALGSDEL